MPVNGSRRSGWDEGGDAVGEFRPVPDALDYLAGSWRVARSVRDLASGEEGAFSGTAVFSPLDGGGLLHHESGTFVWRGEPTQAGRADVALPAG